MNTTLAIALAALAAAALIAGQWALQRLLQRRALGALKGRHLQQQANLGRKLERAKRQIAQLQQELAAARLDVKQRRDRAAPPPVPTREMLSRELDAAPQRPRLPVDGFADTLPSQQFAHAEELLLLL
jgi:hypothetical protein